MTAFGTMIARIAADTKRTDFTSSIGVHIKSAIQHYEPHNYFYTQEHASATATVQEYIALPTGFKSLRSLRASVIGNDPYPLFPRNDSWFNENANPTHKGDPIYYNVTDTQLRLWPLLQRTATLKMAFLRELTAVSASADTNRWFTTGEMLIRTKATEYLYRYSIDSKDKANDFAVQAAIEKEKMDKRNVAFSTATVKPWL